MAHAISSTRLTAPIIVKTTSLMLSGTMSSRSERAVAPHPPLPPHPVDRIPHDRVAAVAEMHADLVRAPGVNRDADE